MLSPVALEEEFPGLGMPRITGRHPDECPECNGLGYTEETRNVMKHTSERKLRTVFQGSGCPACGGTGRRG